MKCPFFGTCSFWVLIVLKTSDMIKVSWDTYLAEKKTKNWFYYFRLLHLIFFRQQHFRLIRQWGGGRRDLMQVKFWRLFLSFASDLISPAWLLLLVKAALRLKLKIGWNAAFSFLANFTTITTLGIHSLSVSRASCLFCLQIGCWRLQ